MVSMNDSTFKFHSVYTFNKGATRVDTTYDYRISQLTQIFYYKKKNLSRYKSKRKIDPLHGTITLAAIVTWAVGVTKVKPKEKETYALSVGAGFAILLNELVWHKMKGLKKYKLKKWQFK